MHHEVWRVGFNNGAGAWFADNMALVELASDMLPDLELYVQGRATISQPSFADAIAEKYGAPV